MAVAQAAVGVQAHFNDAGVQPLVQKVAEVHQQSHQHAPVHARGRGQRQCEGDAADHGLDP